MSLTIRQLRYFQAVAQAGQIARAAAAVHISQPALSVQIKEMETHLGLKLFERQPRKVILTPAGHDILVHANRVLDEITALENTARAASGLDGRLSLGVIPTIAPYLLPEALPLLRAENLGLELRVREAQTQLLLDDLAHGRLDAAIMALPSGAPGLVEIELFEDRFLLAGSSARIAKMQADQAIPVPELIAPHQLLLLDEGHCLADQALAACALDRGATQVDLGASSLSTLCGLVAGGFGLTFLPELALRRELNSLTGISVTRFQGDQPSRRVGLVYRETSSGQTWMEVLARLLQQAGQNLITAVSEN